MSLSDFFIGKPGPGSISEALQFHLPVICGMQRPNLAAGALQRAMGHRKSPGNCSEKFSAKSPAEWKSCSIRLHSASCEPMLAHIRTARCWKFPAFWTRFSNVQVRRSYSSGFAGLYQECLRACRLGVNHVARRIGISQMIFADTIILSDLHLGSEVSRASDAVRMLKSASFNRLILLGDIFSDLNFRRLKKEHWQFLGYIRKLSNPKREIEVVWVEGNHDHGLSDVMSHLVGIRVYRGICLGILRGEASRYSWPSIRSLRLAQPRAQHISVEHSSGPAEIRFRKKTNDWFS